MDSNIFIASKKKHKNRFISISIGLYCYLWRWIFWRIPFCRVSCWFWAFICLLEWFPEKPSTSARMCAYHLWKTFESWPVFNKVAVTRACNYGITLSTGFIKSTDHRPPTTDPPTIDQPTIDHLLTDPPTNRPPTHRLNNNRPRDSISKTLFYRTQIELGWCKTIVRSISYLMNKYLHKIFIYFTKSLSLVLFKRKLLFYKRHTEDLITFIFLHFKPNCFTPSQIFTVYFYVMKFQ